MKFAAWYCLVVGLLIIISWPFFFLTGQVPQLETEPYAIFAHLLAEMVTAVALIATGVALLQRRPWAAGAAPTALGMLVYTVINSSGYFAEQGEWPPVAMFAVLLILALISLYFLICLRQSISPMSRPYKQENQ